MSSSPPKMSVEELAEQVAQLREMLRQEREEHAEASKRAQVTIDKLEERTASKRPAPHGKVAAKKTVVTSTTTATSEETKTTEVRGTSKFSKKQPSGDKPKPAATEQTEVAQPAKTTPVPEKSTPQTTTALQHAWDKFCVRARGEFTVKELSLMSLETLKSLMQHYGYNNPVEVAQVEAQWAIMQEGQQQVSMPTPHTHKSNRAHEVRPIKADSDFDLSWLLQKKPHLSKRMSLATDDTKTSNPNDATRRHSCKDPIPMRGNMHYDPASPSNPNVCSPDRYKPNQWGKRTLTIPGAGSDDKTEPRGKSRSFSPNTFHAGPYPEDYKKDVLVGVKRVPPPEVRSDPITGLRTGYPKKEERKMVSRPRFIPQKHNIILG